MFFYLFLLRFQNYRFDKRYVHLDRLLVLNISSERLLNSSSYSVKRDLCTSTKLTEDKC